MTDFKYNIKAHPTKYNSVMFRSRLEARWAAFFDRAGWKWEYEAIDLIGWSPDFRVEFSCNHSECREGHSLLVEVKPFFKLSDFGGHPCLDYPYGGMNESNRGRQIPADASAAFGANTEATEWEMSHGAGGGVFTVNDWVPNHLELWRQAGEITQWLPSERWW